MMTGLFNALIEVIYIDCCMRACVRAHFNVVYEDTNVYNDMAMTGTTRRK